MSDTYIPPFPTGNSSTDTNYTQAFEKARENRSKPVKPTEFEPVKPKTPLHNSSKSKPIKESNYSLNHQGSDGSKSGSSNNGSSKSGNSKSMNSNNVNHKSGNSNDGSYKSGNSNNGNPNPGYASHSSPKPGRGGRERKEGQIRNYGSSPYNNNVGGNNNNNKSPYNNNAGHDYNNSPYNNSTPRRSEHGRSKKKQGGQTPLHDGILPPFPTGTDTGSNYTEMFNQYHKDNMSPTAPTVQPYRPANEIPPNKARCCCIL